MIMVPCSCCSVVSYAYEINKVLYHPCHAVVVFLCTLQVLNSSPFHSPIWASPTFSLPQAFPLQLALQPPCPAPSLALSLSLYSEAVTLGVHCLGWPHLQLYLPLCVSRSLSGLYNRSRIRAIIAPWLLTAGVYCGFVWEGRTTAHSHTHILTENMSKYTPWIRDYKWLDLIKCKWVTRVFNKHTRERGETLVDL